jgi:hypothetical protein
LTGVIVVKPIRPKLPLIQVREWVRLFKFKRGFVLLGSKQGFIFPEMLISLQKADIAANTETDQVIKSQGKDSA